MARRAPRRFCPTNSATQEVQLESRQLLAQLPGGLNIREWSGGLTEPTTFVSDKINWIYVGEIDGTISRVSTTDGHSESLVRLPAENVDSRGLYSLALDPNFANNGWLYAFYYAVSPSGGREARVSRVDVNASGRPETVLMRIRIKNAPKEHHGGALEVDDRGFLYLAIGDLERPNRVRSLNAPNGKVFRIRTDGTIPKGNPFYHRSKGLGRAVWASGVREPMNSSLDPQTGIYLIHDVGWYQAEEIDRIKRGANYGWPYYEGNRHAAIKGVPGGHVTWPIYFYRNMTSDTVKPKKIARSAKQASAFELRPQDEGCASMGGTFYKPTGQIDDPTLKSLVGNYLFADLCGGWIDSLDFRTKQSSQFASDLGTQILSVDYTNDGRIFVLARGESPGNNQIKVIEPLHQAPPQIARDQSTIVSSVQESVTLQASVTGLGPIQYQWQHNGSDLSGATSPTLVISGTNTTDSPGEYRLMATNPYGTTVSDPWTLVVLNRPRPTAVVTVSREGQSVKTGDVIDFSASGSDAVDGPLPASSLSWTIVLHHNDHTHPLLQLVGTTSGSFVVGDYSFERGSLAIDLTLTVTNSGGLTKTVKKSWPVVRTV